MKDPAEKSNSANMSNSIKPDNEPTGSEHGDLSAQKTTTENITKNITEKYCLNKQQADQLQKRFGVVIIACAILLGIGWIIDGSYHKRQFFLTYLTGWIWALSITLGSLFWVIIHHVTSAGWSVGLRRLYENVTRMIPVLALASIPILIGIGNIYYWVDDDSLQVGKRLWLSPIFWMIRLGIYFSIWWCYASFMFRSSVKMDHEANFVERTKLLRKLEWYAPSGLLLLALTTTFAAFDTIMSLNHHWFSTIFGVIFWADSIRASMSFMVLLVLILQYFGYLQKIITREHFHDLGKLMFGFTIFWAYVSFSQYFLYWYGNQPEETKFFIDRRYMVNPLDSESILIPSSWYSLSILLPIGYFVVPFLLLLRRSAKRNPRILGFTAFWILCFQFYHLFWEILPEAGKKSVEALPESGAEFNWVILPTIFLFISLFGYRITGCLHHASMICLHDPRLYESLHHEVDEFGDGLKPLPITGYAMATSNSEGGRV